ncbi:MAG: group II intron reverse transcriptase domain-containing protein [Lachnospiraceae bacterium]|nr:group II intron reverse transcriptase domain-containing protein [Lachnospiraceae bacterium]
MDIYLMAHEASAWEKFYEDYASNEHAYKVDIKNLRKYIDDKEYLNVLADYELNRVFPIPKLIMLNKKGTGKKRAVFSFDDNVSWLLKFFGCYLHEYDDIFSDSLYSFRRERSVKTAVAKLLKQKDLHLKYGIKLDIHDYFNSADTELIIKKLREVLIGQEKLVRLFEDILRDPGYTETEYNESECIETEYTGIESDDTSTGYKADAKNAKIHKGMMAGSPLSPFLANLYLDGLDKHFDDTDCFYARYSDDIILFVDSREKLDEELKYINGFLEDHGLTLNPDKLMYISPGEGFEFLGFSFTDGKVDVAKASFEKIKKKLRRKARAVERWKKKRQAEPLKAARVYIKYFNKKFFENPVKSELTWCRWYFPIITTDVTLKEIDHYMQECIRFLYTGKHTKRNYDLRYEDIKKLGYRSLLNEYHKGVKNENSVS